MNPCKEHPESPRDLLLRCEACKAAKSRADVKIQNAQPITELRNALPKLLAVIKEMREVLRWYAEGNTQNHEYTAKVDGDLIQQVKRIDLTHEFFTNHKSTDRVISEAEKPDFKVFFGKKARQAIADCEQVIQEGMK